MYTTYKILSGDTLAKISKKSYGTDIHGGHITRANPGLTDLTPGATIHIPRLPDYPGDLPRILGISGENDVKVYISGQSFEFWTDLTITRSIDSIDTITFTAPFDPDAPGYKETFRPFTYPELQVFVSEELLLTGTLVSMPTSVANDSVTITCSGYSLPGVIQDCNPPASSFSLEFNNVSLDDIARAVSKPFGLAVRFEEDPGDTFNTVALKPAQKVHDFLSGLAKQRNLVLSSTTTGDVLFWRSKTVGVPVAALEYGKAPVLSINPQLNEQEYYSHITGISFAVTGDDGSQFTDKNPYLPGVLRPFTFGATDTDNADIKTAVKAKMGRMFANTVSYRLEVSTWRDTAGNLWQPNTTVTLYAPEVYVYTNYSFIIRTVEFRRGNKSESAVLELILPGGFEGKIPEFLPWDF